MSASGLAGSKRATEDGAFGWGDQRALCAPALGRLAVPVSGAVRCRARPFSCLSSAHRFDPSLRRSSRPSCYLRNIVQKVYTRHLCK